ncbi:MAG: beta-ketoacyl synthase N-terminal-like domain-containing protein [Bacteroidales bacterium]|nr:beta-ketoacyl synthase N-terminal-like domain-containing protein [Bacteroidales bacterium]
MDKRRVNNRAFVISDSIISPLGRDTETNMRELMLFHSGVKRVDEKSLYSSPFMGAKIEKDSFLNIEIDIPNDATLLEKRALVAALVAIKAANSENYDKILSETSLILATTKGNIDLIENSGEDIKYSAFPGVMASRIAKWLGIKGAPLTISSACISGVNAIIEGARLIERGDCKNVLIIGADLLSRFVITGFESFKSVSSSICLPYDLSRDGLNLGEAVAAVLLSSDRDLCKDINPVVIEGGAITNDANHLSAPSRTGDGLGISMLQAMEDAGVESKQISFINAHGTSTIYNDEMESKAIHFASLQELPVQSLKPFFGHTLGASGVVEIIASAWQMKNSLLFGTRGFKELGVPMEIKVTPHHSEQNLYRCIKSASGFGGCNASIVLALESASVSKFKQEYGQWEELASYELSGEDDFDTVIREKYKELNIKDIKFFKMDGLSRLGVIGTFELMRRAGDLSDIDPFKKGMLLANRSSSLDTDIKHQMLIDAGGDSAASPAVFVYTLPNIVIGEIAIRNQFKGENIFFLYEDDRGSVIHSDMLKYADSSMLEMVICGWCDYLKGKYSLNLKLYKRDVYGK